jgi:hypothetical protein
MFGDPSARTPWTNPRGGEHYRRLAPHQTAADYRDLIG